MWHGFSWKVHVISRQKSTAVWSKSTPTSMTIPCCLSRFPLFSMLKHDMDFRQVQVMNFPWHLRRKWTDFPRIWSHFWRNCREKGIRKYMSVPFFTGFFNISWSQSTFTPRTPSDSVHNILHIMTFLWHILRFWP